MKIGFLLASIAMTKKYNPGIFAPSDVFKSVSSGFFQKKHPVFLYTAPRIEIPGISLTGDEYLSEHDFKLSNEFINNPDAYTELLREYVAREYDLDLISRVIKHANKEKLDILHDFGTSYAAMHLNKLLNVPFLISTHSDIPQKDTLTYWRLKKYHHLNYVFLSKSQKNRYEHEFSIKGFGPVYHGLQMEDYPFQPVNKEKNLLCLGRYVKEKGIGTAVQLALKLKTKIILASSSKYHQLHYYQQEIKPYIKTEYVTEMDLLGQNVKNQIIGNSKVLLFPIEWEEPFGLVMIESMACGTPVVAYARGSVPEIIKDGETGFIVNPSDDDIRGDFIVKKTGVEGLKEAIERLYALSEKDYRSMRQACRKHVEDHFTVEKMVNGYEKVYQQITNSTNLKYGEPWARLVPTVPLEKKEKDPSRFFGFLKKSETGVEFENKIRRNKAEKKRIKSLRKR